MRFFLKWRKKGLDFSANCEQIPNLAERRKGMIYESLRKRVKYLDSLISGIKKLVQKQPEGYLKSSLVHKKDGCYFQYYVRQKKSDPSGRYLAKAELSLAKKLAQKEYNEKALKVAERERNRISKFLEHFDENALLKVYTEMNEGKRILVEPYVLPDEEYARRWLAKQYEGGKFEEGDSEYYTKRGDRVRSKSEQIIADRLFDAGIPYRYEYPFIYDSPEGKKQIFTDFTILNKRTRTIYRWEHFGRMDDPKYRRTFFWKQSVYSRNKCIPGVGIIFTFEDNDNPLDTRYVDKLIETYLL